ncbi:MAG TPA: F0F1 ATP synthase subunit delta [Candidatus Peribacteria bacterium]|nr:F0F1 ATP synthase subunit delta [Candidatus Peribacteria bacterium]
MRIKPADIAKALVDEVIASPASADAACLGALQMLKKKCPGFLRRDFVKLVDREMRTRGDQASGLLIVPNAHSIKADAVGGIVTKHSGIPVNLTEKIDPDLIGGAVLVMDHRRIDASVQGALRELLQTCLEPINV